MRRMFAPGDRVRITQPAPRIRMGSTPEQELSVELSIPGQRWLREACVAALAAGSTLVEEVGSKEQAAEAATAVDAKDDR